MTRSNGQELNYSRVRPLSFCFITTFYPPNHFGGEAMYLYRLSNALAKRGHRVTVVHCVDAYRLLSGGGAPRGTFPHHPNVTVHALQHPLGPLSPLVTYLAGIPGLKSTALHRIFAGARFDVVHFHLVTLFGPAVLRYGEGALRLYTTHDHWFVCPMYDLWKDRREICEKPQCLKCQLINRRPPQLWRYTDLLARELPRIDMFFSPSRSTITQQQRRGFTYPIRHLPLFLPSSEMNAPPHPGNGVAARPYFLFVGRLVKIKGVQTIIDAFRRYRDADLVIAGDGEYEDELTRHAAGLDHVRFLGRVTPDALRGLYRGAIALLVPSLVYETFGFITLESLAQRTPVIGREIGAVAELVRDTGGGITYQTEQELLDAMRLLGANPSKREELAATGYTSAMTRYSEDSHIAAYLGAINEAVAKRRPSGWPAD